jgi:hypothetical protein
MKRIEKIGRRLISAVFVTCMLCSSIQVFGQAPKGSKTAGVKTASSATACSAAWTGSITYQRTQSMTNHKEVPRVSARGSDTTEFEMNYEYNAQVAVVESPERKGSSVGKASVSQKMSSVEHIEAREKNSCDRGKTWQEMSGSSWSKTNVRGQASQLDANVGVGVNADGTYSVSVALPQIRGIVSGSQTSTYSGQCTKKEGKNLTMPETETTIDGNSLTSDGKDRIDDKNPNSISGSYALKGPGDVVERISWSLQKCGAPLRITDIKFADMKFPNWNDWREINEQTGTIDGNLVKVTALVLNGSGETKYGDVRFKETYKGDKWDGARPDAALNDTVISASFPAGDLKEVEMVWDSSGYAWYDDGRPRLVQRIKAELEENSKKVSEHTENLKVAPKPLVLVHGAWSHWMEFQAWQNILTTSHSYDWKAFPVGEVTNKGIINTGREVASSEQTNTTVQNAETLAKYIRYAQEDRNAWHVDVVARSIGGLIARYYIQNLMPNVDDGRPLVSHLLMLGTPNLGTPCADVMDAAFELTGKSPHVVKEMRQDSVAEFNKRVSNRKGVKFSALAGNILPATCKYVLEPNDGFVPVPSAVYGVSDKMEMSKLANDMTDTVTFSQFVKPRVAIGPKGNHTPDAPVIPKP